MNSMSSEEKIIKVGLHDQSIVKQIKLEDRRSGWQ